MAFTGTDTQKILSESKIRVTGLSLGIGAAGTIQLSGQPSPATADLELLAGFKPSSYATTGATPAAQAVLLSDSVNVQINLASAEAVAPAVQVEKAIVSADLLITLTNGGAAATGDLELIISFH